MYLFRQAFKPEGSVCNIILIIENYEKDSKLTISWYELGTIIFIAVFINLCSKKSILAFKDDIAIMRSMGIQSKVIKIATYVRMIISSIFGIIAMIASAIFIYVFEFSSKYGNPIEIIFSLSIGNGQAFFQ